MWEKYFSSRVPGTLPANGGHQCRALLLRSYRIDARSTSPSGRLECLRKTGTSGNENSNENETELQPRLLSPSYCPCQLSEFRQPGLCFRNSVVPGLVK